MTKNLKYLSVIVFTLLLFSNKHVAQTLELGTLSSFEAYTGKGAVTNSGLVTGDAGTDAGIIGGNGFNYGYTGTIHKRNNLTAQAKIDLLRIYIHLSDIFVNYPGTHAPAFETETITSGVYSIPGAGSLGGTLTLDGRGDPNAFFIIKFNGAFTVGANSTIVLSNGARAANVFWIAEGAISVAASSEIKGTLLSFPGAITLGVNSKIEGRMLASEGAITIESGAAAKAPVGPISIPIKCLGDCGPTPALDILGSLKKFALFSSFGAVANTATSGFVGDVGAHNGSLTGFGTSTIVGAYHKANEITRQAKIDLESAYSTLMALPNTNTRHTPVFGLGETLNSGVYHIEGAGSLSGTLTLDGLNNPDAVFVFKFAGALSVAAQANVILINGAQRCNIFWLGGAGVDTGAVSMGAFSSMKGTIISHGGACTMAAGGKVEGRMFSTDGAIGFSTGIVYTDTLCFGDDTPISGGDQTICSDGTNTQIITATASSNTTSGIIRWYDALTGGALVANPIQVGIGSKTYFAESYNGVYASLNRVAVALVINNCDVENTFPVAVDDAYTTREEVSVFLLPLTGDSDVDLEDTLTIISINGTLLTPGTAQNISVINGTVQITATGIISFVSSLNFNGISVFPYTISDGLAFAVANLTITVTNVNDAPVAMPDVARVNEDVTLIVAKEDGLIDLNDTDIEQESTLILTKFVVAGVLVNVTLVSPGSTSIAGVGNLSLSSDGSYRFVPMLNYNGEVPKVTYTISDGENTANSTLDITVNAINDAPVAVDNTYTTREEVVVILRPLSGDSDVDVGDNLTIVSINGTSLTPGVMQTIDVPDGTVEITSTGIIRFVSDLNFIGVSTFPYTISDGLAFAVANQVITITTVNDAPIARPDTASVDEEVTLTVTKENGLIELNDTDVDQGSTLILTKFIVAGVVVNISPGASGSTLIAGVGNLSVQSDGSYIFTPILNFNGAVPRVTYTISDGVNTANSTLSITVKPINDAPLAADDFTGASQGISVDVPVLINDTDPDGDTITITSIVTFPTNGIVEINVNKTTIRYTPNAGFNGLDSFTYQITDGNGSFDTAVVEVKDATSPFPPVANPDIVRVAENTTLSVDAIDGVLKNDTDLNFDILTVVNFSIFGFIGEIAPGTEFIIPNVGTINLNVDGGYVFIPEVNFIGLVPEITYRITDGTHTASSTLRIIVRSVNDVPIAFPDANTTAEDIILNVLSAAGMLANDVDADMDSLSIINVTVNGIVHAAGVTIAFAEGTLLVNSDGSYTFIPAKDFNGVVPIIKYTVSDGILNATSTLDLTVTPINDAPVARPDINATDENTVLRILAGVGLLSNDFDADLEPLLVTQFSVEGKTSTTGVSITFSAGMVLVNSDGSYTFTPAVHFNGVVPTIIYTISDGSVLKATSTLDLIVRIVNDAPIALPDARKTDEDVALKISSVYGLLANDFDHDLDPLSLTQVTVEGITTTVGITATFTGGTFLVNSDGSYLFIPTKDFSGAVPTITYTVSDGSLTATSTLQLIVNPINDFPVANPDINAIDEDVTLRVLAAVGLLANDADVDLDPLSVIQFTVDGITSNAGIMASCEGGAVLVNSDGSYTFTPATNFNGIVPTITYTVSDGILTAASSLKLIVRTVNDLPVANPDINISNEDTTLNVLATAGLLANDFDADKDQLIVAQFSVEGIIWIPGATAIFTGGTLIINLDGSYRYTPAKDFNGVVPAITYTISDGSQTANSILRLTVRPINDAPIAINDLVTTNQRSAITIETIGANDIDIDGFVDPTTIILTDPYNPSNTGKSSRPLVLSNIGTFTIDIAGNLTFTPVPEFSGLAAINYTLKDNNGETSNEGAIDITVQGDNDGDGVLDFQDLDDDNDGILDTTEQNGALQRDTDNDGIPDYLDLDSDGDGLNDLEESFSGAIDANNDGIIDGAQNGSGTNGLFDGVEVYKDGGVINYKAVDTDNDGILNFQDTDDDGDTMNSKDEDVNFDGNLKNDDTDQDGVPDYLDADDDGDEIPTKDELMFDCDMDNIMDHLDVTSCNLIPNGFSPNGDGVNDTFVIPELSKYPNFKLEIFNRWGNQVYYYNNNSRESPLWWDGFSTGRLTLNNTKPVPVGTYNYIIYFNNGTRKPISGWVYLNR
jgi:gliding motility-associated-like protein